MEDPIKKELENESNDRSEDEMNNTQGLSRQQLEIEYNAALQEREMLLNQLAKCLENMMKS